MKFNRTEIEFIITNILNEIKYDVAVRFGRTQLVRKLGTMIMNMPDESEKEFTIEQYKILVSNKSCGSKIEIPGRGVSTCAGMLWDNRRTVDSNTRGFIYMLNEAWNHKAFSPIHKRASAYKKI